MRLLLLLSALLTALAGMGSPAYAATVPAHQTAEVSAASPARAAKVVAPGRPIQALPVRTAILHIADDTYPLIGVTPIVVDRLRV